MGSLETKRALVTGGKGDLATAISDCLKANGYEVSNPGREELDVTSSVSVKTYFASLGEIGLLVNNAGLTRDVVHTRLSEEEWDAVIDTNLKGAFLCSQSALKAFPKKVGGHIINIGSFSGKSPPVGQANYAAAKAGLIGLSQSLAKEYGRRNVRVNTVLPGFLETKMTATLSENAIDRIRSRHTLGRFNTVEDAAEFIVFLDRMNHISGQTFQLDSRI